MDLLQKLELLKSLSEDILYDAIQITNAIDEGDELLTRGIQSYFLAPFTYLDNKRFIDEMINSINNLKQLNQ